MFFLWAAFAVLSVVAFVAILFTGRYPKGIFDFNVGVLRWTWRVQYYAIRRVRHRPVPAVHAGRRPGLPGALRRRLPGRLSRGLALVKWWLLALPHYVIVAIFVGGASWGSTHNEVGAAHWVNTSGGSWPGLISLLVLVSAVILLFTGRYPRSLFDLVLGLNRWVLRVVAYAGLMTDKYPPFRLDMGEHEPGSSEAGGA